MGLMSRALKKLVGEVTIGRYEAPRRVYTDGGVQLRVGFGEPAGLGGAAYGVSEDEDLKRRVRSLLGV